jgi:LacI family kdg operon repressor
MDRSMDGTEIDTVMLDNEKASFLAVEALLKRGYSEIAVVSPPLQANVPARVERLSGYKKALHKHRLPFHEHYLVSGEISDMQVRIDELMNQPVPPKAILALNDLVLIEVLTYVKKQKMRIPEDVALVGIDDVPFAEIYSPALTTVAQPAYEMGERAANLLFDYIRNKERANPAQVFRFEPQLIIRESC